MKTLKNIYPAATVLLFVLASFWLGYVKDVSGITWDEPWQQNLAAKSYDFATGKNEALLSIQNRYHGGSFETLSEAVCKTAGVYSFAGKVKVRRTVLIFFFFAGAICLYFAAIELTQKRWAGFLALLLLFFTPRIMAHAAYNTKDIPVLAAACFFLWMALLFKKNPGIKTSVSSAIACGLMISLRIPAVYTLLLWIGLWAFTVKYNRQRINKALSSLVVFLGILGLSVYLFWPILWGNPIERFAEAWQFMSRFPWDNPVLFMGKYIMAAELPFYYIPFWILITVPPVWVFLFLLSIPLIFIVFYEQDWDSFVEILFLSAYVLIPIVAVIALNSVVYDEWRHVFFIYPGIVLLSVWALGKLSSLYPKKVVFYSFILLIIFQITEVGAWVYQNRHYSYLYFNPAFRGYACGSMEQDYWGLSYKQANEKLLSLPVSRPLKIAYVHDPGMYNYWNLEDSEKEQLVQVAYDEAEFLITNHRFEKESFNFGTPLFEKTVNGCVIYTIYRR